MSLLVFFIFLSIGVSFLCSLLEAVILSVTPSFLGSLKKNKPKLYNKVQYLKQDIEKPLASILTFNTIAHTVGAAGAGAEAQRIFGSDILAVFSALLTFAILFFSEIIPKSIGASSWRGLLPFAATILKPMITISYPLVWMSQRVSSFIKKKPSVISKEEIAALADIGFSDGAIDRNEHRAMHGLIHFENIKATEIMTGKEKIQSLKPRTSVKNAYHSIRSHRFSRIPILTEDKSKLKGYVLRTKLLDAYIENPLSSIEEITHKLLILKDDVSLPRLLESLLVRREHICAIENSSAGFIGIITLEDLIEHMLNVEIYDEQDHLNP